MISVVIPTFNRKTLLIEAIESVLAQTFRDWELIVVDDGSTDGTEEKLKRLLCPEIRYIRQRNQGVSRARNRGIQTAVNDWIAFLDSDDYWHKDKLRLQLEALDANPEYRAAHTDEVWIRSGVRVNPGKRHRKHSGWIFHHCLRLCLISPSSVLLHRSLFDESLPVCEDYDLWLRITARQPVLFHPDKLVVKRGGHQDQLSRSRWGMDRYRVQALLKAAGSGRLTPQQKKWVAAEIVYKSGILELGFQKRSRTAQAAYYSRLRTHFRNQTRPPDDLRAAP